MPEKGGRYFQEARFFFLGDKPVAQSHVPEARAMLGYLRDMQALGGPPIQVKYATLQDGTKIKATMMNGQYQAIIESGSDDVKSECPVLRFIQVVTETGSLQTNRIGKPFNLSGYPHGVPDGPHPQILFGSDISGYWDYDAFKDEYGLTSFDVLDPIGTPDEFAIGAGNAFWIDGNDKDGGALSWGKPLGLGAPVANAQQGVYWLGKTIALPCTSIQSVVGAAFLKSENSLITFLVVVTSEVTTPTTSSIIRVKYAAYSKGSGAILYAGGFTEAGNTVLDVSGYSNIGNPVGLGATAWNAGVDLYKFSKDATHAGGVITGRGVSTIVLTHTGGSVSCVFNQIKTIAAYTQTGTGGGCTGGVGTCATNESWVVAAAYTSNNLLQILWYQRNTDALITSVFSSPTIQVVNNDRIQTTVFYLRDDGVDTQTGKAVFTLFIDETYTYPLSGTGNVCGNETMRVRDEEWSWNIDRCPVAYAIDHRFLISSTVIAKTNVNTVTTRDVDTQCDVVPGTSSSASSYNSTYSIGLVRHAAGREDSPISKYEGDGNFRLSGIATSPPQDVKSVVFDANNFVIMLRLAEGFNALPVAPFSAPNQFDAQCAFSVGVWADCGKFKPIPFIGKFFYDGLETSADFGLVSARKANPQ